MGYLCLYRSFVWFIAVVAISYWDSWHWLGLELCQPALQLRGKLDGTWLLPKLPSAFLLPTKSLQSLTLVKLLGLPLALQLEDVAFPLSQKIFSPLLLGAESGGSFGAGLTCIPSAPCWALCRAAMLRDGAEGAGSSHGLSAPGCTCFLKRLITGA